MQVFEDKRTYMNTQVSIAIISKEGTVFSREKIAQAFDKFDYVVNKFSRFSKNSELSKLNDSPEVSLPVSEELFKLVKYSLELAHLTDGLYDPTIIDVLESYGFDKNQTYQELSNPSLMKNIKKKINTRPLYKEIILDEEIRSVTLKKNQGIDLGGVGKGYAIDLAYQTLEKFKAVKINAGGDIRTNGKNEKGENWNIGLSFNQLPNKKIHTKNVFGTVSLNNQSICGSGGWARRIKFFHHLLNPKTGLPVNEVSQSFIIANTAMEADAWATALFVMGEPGLDLVKEHGLEGLLILSDGTIVKTKGFKYKSS